MSKSKKVYTTADLRKYLGEILGRAHYQSEVVRISHHKRPYAAVVSQEDADFLDAVKQLTKERFHEVKERVDEIVENGKGLDELVETIEHAKTSSRLSATRLDETTTGEIPGPSSDRRAMAG